MANAKRKCCGCKKRFPADQMIKLPVGYFHSFSCSIEYAGRKTVAKASASIKKEQKAARAKHRQDKDRVKPRSEWLNNLQTVVNQWVVHVRDKLEGCCTCGKTTQGIKYDAGHMISRGSSSELRFELTNIHKQCSVECNQYGAGKRKEYETFIIRKYGQDHLDWLIGPHELLKDQLPHYTDIKKEIQRFRVLLREAGLKPNY